MFNLIVHGAAGYLEQPDLDMLVERFDTYSGWEAESLDWGVPADLKRLEQIPTLLMYEIGVDGENAELVRHGRITNLARYGRNFSFEFVPDTDRPFLDRDSILQFETQLGMDRFEQARTHWAIKDGDIPPKLLARAKTDLSDRMQDGAQEQSPVHGTRTRSTRGEGQPAAPVDEAAASAEATEESARVVAIVVGIETYRPGSDGIKPVAYAKADAEAFARALELMFADLLPEISVLTDQDATLNDIREEIRNRAYGLGPNDLFIFYYAGHGFHGGTGNRLTAWDSRPINFEGTTLSVRDDLLEPIRKSACERALAFVDACASDLRTAARDVLAEFNPQELKTFLDKTTYISLFAACAPNQKSYSHDSLKHGVWTYFLLKALEGEPRALGVGGMLTSTSLQDYLRAEVPRFTNKHIKASQTPTAILEATGTFAIKTYEPVSDVKSESGATLVTPRSSLREAVGAPSFTGTSTQFFDDRFRTAFPGVRSIRWFEQPDEIAERLGLLLRDPLNFDERTPVWWWRDGNLQIEQFALQADGTYLMNHTELDIAKIAAVPGNLYWQSFVYVQCRAMPPSGAYVGVDERIQRHLDLWHYSFEEYGRVDSGHAVSREEYDDGGAEINGRVVNLQGRVQLRSRYLTPYNFLIAPIGSRINHPIFDKRLAELLNAILDDDANFTALIDEIGKLPRREREL
ncbi:caspase family protein [Asticcacaulis tiandongensis]|uniref:caspase family protein n=1 Tax=Asticcacaulis tiandongensis TaxID=2565365 RepID=UPI00112DFCD1|nr:caspase family protein [Asticcacaulis tiandongensis]